MSQVFENKIDNSSLTLDEYNQSIKSQSQIQKHFGRRKLIALD